MSISGYLRLAGQGLLLLLGGALATGVFPVNAADLPPVPGGLAAPSKATRLPAFDLPEINGAMVHAGELRGKVVIIRFWATW